jgi:hypothetical protein
MNCLNGSAAILPVEILANPSVLNSKGVICRNIFEASHLASAIPNFSLRAR